MKIFTFICSFYILALSCLPCNDVDNCETDSTNIKLTATQKQHKESKNSDDNCTPFCVCSCCAVAVYVQPVLHCSVVQHIFPSVKYSSYKSTYTNTILVAIWQPPKFC